MQPTEKTNFIPTRILSLKMLIIQMHLTYKSVLSDVINWNNLFILLLHFHRIRDL